jgi:predicted ATPase/DNA-binding XRE family transcriptional regulator
MLRVYRSAQRLSQEALAERAGVSPRTVSDIECGVARSPRAMTLTLLAEALELADDDARALHVAARSTTERERLLGRAKELAAVAELLRDNERRLVTIVGPAGVGKTALAHATEQSLVDAFARIVRVEVSALPQCEHLLPAIAHEFGLRDAPGDPLVELAAQIADAPALLVLDTLDRITGAGGMLARLLGAIPSLHILATSRTPLRVRAERAFALAPLTLPQPGMRVQDLARNPAVALLIERASVIDPPLMLDAANADDIAKLVRALDGNPLAIELAAPNLRFFTPAALTDRLDRRLSVLVDGATDLPQRQRTMRDAIAWSADMLDAGTAEVLRAISVFPSNFGADTAAVIADRERSVVLRDLGTLVDANLAVVVARDATPRFALSPFVREFASDERDARGESDRVFARLCTWCLELASRVRFDLGRTGNSAQMETIERESPQFEAALAWARDRGEFSTGIELAYALWPSWWLRGRFASGVAWVRALVDGADRAGLTLDAIAEIRAYQIIAGLTQAQGLLDESDAASEQALARVRKLGDRQRETKLLAGMGVTASVRGDYDRADALFEQVVDYWKTLDPMSEGHAESLCDRARNLVDAGRATDAKPLLDEALVISRSLESAIGVSAVLMVEALSAANLGSFDAAERIAGEVVRMTESIGFPHPRAMAFMILARVALEADDRVRAREHCLAAMHVATAASDSMVLAMVTDVLGEVSALDEPELAARLFGVGHGLRRRHGYSQVAARKEAVDRTAAAVRERLGGSAYDAEMMIGSAQPTNVIEELLRPESAPRNRRR